MILSDVSLILNEKIKIKRVWWKSLSFEYKIFRQYERFYSYLRWFDRLFYYLKTQIKNAMKWWIVNDKMDANIMTSTEKYDK